MTTFQIKSRYDSNRVVFECKLDAEIAGASFRLQLGFAVKAAIKAGADLAGADLAGADLAGADLARAYLAGADLAGAYLAGANLAGAYLARADLAGADLAGADFFDEKITKPVTQLLTEKWLVIIGETKIKIGCQLHKITEWQSFDDAQISKMSSHALSWWRVWKAPILEICKATGKLEA